MDSIHADSTIISIDFSHDSRYFAHLCRNGKLYLRDVLRESDAGEQSFLGEVSCIDLGNDRQFAVAKADEIQIWKSANNRGLDIPLADDRLSFLLFDDEAKRLAAAFDDGTITVWDLDKGTVLSSGVPQPIERDWEVLPGAGFGVMYVLGTDRIRLLGLSPVEQDVTLTFERDARVGVTLSRDGRWLASLSPGGAVEVRRLPDGLVHARIEGFETPPTRLSLSPDGSVIAAAREGFVELWDTARAERLDRFETTVWPDGGIRFSPHGYLVAWVEENRTSVRFWSPMRGVVQWTSTGPGLIELAKPVCPDLASIIRFRLATEPYERGRAHLANGNLEKAIAEFDEASVVFVAYPGLAPAVEEARGRHRAKVRAAELEAELADQLDRGDYYTAVSALETFLREHSQWGDYGFERRVATLRTMLQHLEAAQAHRKAERPLDAVEEFEKASALLPDLTRRHPEYGALRVRLLASLADALETEFAAKRHARCLEIYADLRRLRPLEGVDWLRLGTSHEALGQRQPARDAYRHVAAGTPEYARAQQSLARIARAAGELERARAAIEEARDAAPTKVSIESDYAEICELLSDFDGAVAAWYRVSELVPENPEPFVTVGRIEGQRGRWPEAGQAYGTAIRRSSTPRPDLLVKMAAAYQRAEEKEKVLEAYVDLLQLAREGVELPDLGERPETKVRTWIRELGYVRHRKEWIPREQFLAEQGWVRHGETWLRPEEAQLRGIAARVEQRAAGDLRTLPAVRYRSEADEKGILEGMNRSEIIRAWGYFDDQNVLELGDGSVVYEQLLFRGGRRVYLRNGLVCFWSE